MALTPFRWLAALVAGCLVLSVLVLHEDASFVRITDPAAPYRDRVGLHARHAAVVARQLRLDQLLDSTRVRDTSGSPPRFRVFMDKGMPAGWRSVLDSMAAHAATTLRGTTGTAVDAAFIFDTLSAVRGAIIERGGTTTDYILPRRLGDRCTVIAHVRPANARQLTEMLRSPNGDAQLFGPCLYYGAFGLPGRKVDAWLREHGWLFTGDGSWTREGRPISLYDNYFYRANTMAEAFFGVGTSVAYFNEMSVEGVQCAARRENGCEQVLTEVTLGRPPFWRGNILFQAYAPLSGESDWYYTRGAFGRRQRTLLSDMVRTLGRERFARFWRSEEAVPSAFAAAAGEPLDAWASRWAVARYGPVPALGAGLSPVGSLISVALLVLGFAVALGVSARRQFT